MPATMGVRVRFHKGAWYLFIDHQGRRRAKKIGDKQTALEVARAVRERLARGDLGLFDAAKAETFETYAARWLDASAAGRRASTQRFYALNLKLHIYPALGARPIAAVSRADCRDVLAACRQKGLKLASLKGVQRTLSAVLTQAVEDQLPPANPGFRMGKHLRTGDEPRAEIRPLTALEAHQFITGVQTHEPRTTDHGLIPCYDQQVFAAAFPSRRRSSVGRAADS